MTAGSGGSPAGLQWTLTYPSSDITSFSVAAGSALTAAGKTLSCGSGTGQVICVASGINANTVGNGVVAVVTATVASGTSSSSDSIPISNALATYPNASVDTTTATGGTLTLVGGAPVITSATTASGTVGTVFSYQIAATNSPTSYAATGLPSGLSVSSTSGLISGTPTAAGTSTVSLSATNSTGTGNATLTVTVTAAAPVITSATTASGTVGTAFSYQIAATNSPTSYAATGLPGGLSVSSTSGLISGTPTTAGTSTVSLSATNSTGTGKATLTLTISAAPAAISFVQATASAASSSASSLAVSFPAKTNAGDLILVAFDFTTSTTLSSVTDSQHNSFTEVGTQLTSPGGARSRVYYATDIKGGSDTVTIKLSGRSTVLEVYLNEYSGVNTTSPIDVQAGSSGSAGSVSSGSATTTAAGDLIYGFCIGDSACTVGSSFTARSTFHSNLTEDKLAATAGSYAATGTANSGWTMQMVALRPASAAAPALTSARTPVTTTAGTSRTAPASGSGALTLSAVPAAPAQSQAVTGLYCVPRIVPAGGQATCELRATSDSAATPIQLTTSTGQVKAPGTVATRANQTRLTFQVIADPTARAQAATITAVAGMSTAQDTIQVQAMAGPVLTVPGAQTAAVGKPLRFQVAAVDPAGLPVQLTASHVPAGASFDAASGTFEWTPAVSQSGRYPVTFGAVNSAGQSSSAQVAVNIGSGLPTVAGTEPLACSPGAIATLKGSGFAAPGSAFSDPSGQSMALGGTSVQVNGQPVPVLAVSEARVTFLCPASEPGTPLAATVVTEAGSSNPVTAAMLMAT
ncbi:MAG TPA: putative Ig domain-containing protein, partial [Bryobacteraceae bacterium]|nr:putative Ig domain-containing protein [Bryobacteraceae bacterium]